MVSIIFELSIRNTEIMKKFYALLSATILSLLTVSAVAQDAHFSQFYSSPVYLNPSLVGMSGQYRAVLAHREQGAQSQGFSTSLFSFDAPLGNNSGWGVQMINDNQMGGVLNSTSYAATLGHRIDVSKDAQIGLGVQVGFYQKSLNWGRLTFEDQIDQRNGVVTNTQETFGNNNITQPDVNIGAVYSSTNFFGGVKLSHINNPRENFAMDSETVIPLKTTLHMGGFLPVFSYRQQGRVLSPNIIYERQGSFEYLHLGIYYGSEVWTAGLWHRVNDAIIASVGMNVSKFRFGYSYDVAINEHNAQNGNAHEISVGYQFDLPSKFKVKNNYKGRCPKFQKHLF